MPWVYTRELLDATLELSIYFFKKSGLKIGESWSELIRMKSLIQMAIELRKRSRFEEALRYAKRALTLGERMGNLKIQAAALAEIGQLYFALGERSLARRDWHRAYIIFVKLNEHEKCARLQLLMANDLRLSGYLNPAVRLYKKILKSAEARELTELKAIVYGQLGLVLRELDRNVEAEACYERAIKAGEESSHWPVVYKSMLGLAELLVSKNKFEKADQYYTKAKAWFERSGEPHGGLLETVAAKAALKTGRIGEAKEIYVTKFYKTQNGLQKALIAEQLINVAISENDFESAKKYYQCALKLFYENRAPGWGRWLKNKNYFDKLDNLG